MHGASPDPVKGDKVPGEGPRDGADVDGPRGGAVAEVGKGEVEEVDDDEQLGEPEVGADPEVEEAEEEQVGGDVVGADVGGGSDVDGVAGVQGVGVDELEEEDEDPGGGSAVVFTMQSRSDGEGNNIPVDARHDAVLGEGGRGVVAPDGVTRLVAFIGVLEGVVDGSDQEDDVGNEGGDAVEDQLAGREVFPTRERVRCRWCEQCTTYVSTWIGGAYCVNRWKQHRSQPCCVLSLIPDPDPGPGPGPRDTELVVEGRLDCGVYVLVPCTGAAECF
jgi:hypothetical protein